jgi:acyl carrier protein
MTTRHTIDRAAILAEITDIVRTVFGDPYIELTPEMTSDDLPVWDSMNYIRLVVEAECRFDIEFQAVEIEDVKTVGELVQMIEAKVAVVHA